MATAFQRSAFQRKPAFQIDAVIPPPPPPPPGGSGLDGAGAVSGLGHGVRLYLSHRYIDAFTYYRKKAAKERKRAEAKELNDLKLLLRELAKRKLDEATLAKTANLPQVSPAVAASTLAALAVAQQRTQVIAKEVDHAQASRQLAIVRYQEEMRRIDEEEEEAIVLLLMH